MLEMEKMLVTTMFSEGSFLGHHCVEKGQLGSGDLFLDIHIDKYSIKLSWFMGLKCDPPAYGCNQL